MALLRALVFGFCAVITIVYAIGHGGFLAVNMVIERDAIDKAQRWAKYLTSQEDFWTGSSEVNFTALRNLAVPAEVRNLGDVLRFDLRDLAGNLQFSSADEPALKATEPPIKRAIPINFGAAQDHAMVLVNARVALKNATGKVIGVFDIYINQSETQAYFSETFRRFGSLLMAFVAIVFAVPGIAFLVQHRFAQKSRRHVEFLARYDPLTGLLNRREFMRQAEDLVSQKRLTVVCYLDVDRFKTINDAYGHARGDAYLVHIAQTIRRHCRNNDLIARFGGDEFVIGLTHVSAEAATMRMRALLKECARVCEIDDKLLSSSISVGIAIVEDSKSLTVALSEADAALYHVKSTGRNSVAAYGAEMGEELRRRHELEAYLREATRNKRFEIHYQPLVDVTSHQVIGHEALLRLTDPNGQSISPTVFIPIAEDLGLIDEIGAWTLRTATAEMAQLHPDKMLAINLSSAQFLSGELVSIVKASLEASGLPASLLELEITESLLLEDSVFVEMQIDTLKELGVSIVMDDFGTGFSSLSYLWKYGFDRLKIDRSFVAALEENPERSREIIETVIMLGARLNMKITAEGVETYEQSELLASLGCDVLQGYYFGKATPLSRVPIELSAKK